MSTYTKLCCKYTAGANSYSDGLRLRLNTLKYTAATGYDSYATHSSNSLAYSQENGIFTLDISQLTDGSYYVVIGGSGATDTYIYQIWFDKYNLI